MPKGAMKAAKKTAKSRRRKPRMTWGKPKISEDQAVKPAEQAAPSRMATDMAGRAFRFAHEKGNKRSRAEREHLLAIQLDAAFELREDAGETIGRLQAARETREHIERETINGWIECWNRVSNLGTVVMNKAVGRMIADALCRNGFGPSQSGVPSTGSNETQRWVMRPRLDDGPMIATRE